MTSKITSVHAHETRRSQGADVTAGGVFYRTWCKHDHVAVTIVDQGGGLLRTVPMHAEGAGYFSGIDKLGAAGDLYQFRFGDSQGWPDPASRWQPTGVHGPSMVIDPESYSWGDADSKAPRYQDLVVYELHIGTFTREGTFGAALAKLDHVATLGANAIELMPVADFPGERNWGYDGVSLYAPSRAYGHPDDLRALVDAAHARGLAVILDVVYNHLGPDGNYLGVFHDGYFNPEHHTPWGAGLHFEAQAVRDFFTENAIYWMREFHIDGFRLDATHAILDFSPRHILAEISQRVHEAGGFLIAEDERNEPALLRTVQDGGLGFDGVWSDDFHHVMRVLLTGEREGYYENYLGTSEELTETLQHGWLFRGQRRNRDGAKRGKPSIDCAPEQFVYCISNHDQVGNRALGERLNQLIEPAAYRAASAFFCLVPYTPMLFMGQEWAGSTPFQFFTDHHTQLGQRITEGRRQEFRDFAAFRDPRALETIPDPQAESTFANSKLRWEELKGAAHAPMLQLYREFLALRKTHPALQDRARGNWEVRLINDGITALTYGKRGSTRCTVLFDSTGKHRMPALKGFGDSLGQNGTVILSSNESRFGGPEVPLFSIPTTVVLEWPVRRQ